MKKAVFASLLPFVLFAKDFTFDEILSKALENNKELQAKKMGLKEARARYKEISSKKFGEISINENFYSTNHPGYVFNSKLSSREATFGDFGFGEFNGQNQLIAPKALNKPEKRDNFETTVEYKLPIFTGFMLSNEEEAAKLYTKAAEVLQKRDEKKLSLEVLKGYNGAVAAKKYVAATELSLKNAQMILHDITQMYEQKFASKTDLLEAELAVAMAKERVFEAQKNYRIALEYLKFLADDESIDGVSSFFEPSLPKGSANERDELKAAKLFSEAAAKRSDATISEHLPKLYGFAKYGFNDDKLSLSSSKDFYIVGLAASMSITDFGGASARREIMKAEAMKASFEAASMAGYAKFDAIQKELTIKQKELSLEQKKAASKLARQIFENYKLKHKNGLTTVTELIKKEAELLAANASEIAAVADLINAKAEYKYAIGLGVKE